MVGARDAEDLEVRFWGRVLRRRKLLIVSVLAVSTAAALAVGLLLPSGYSASAEVLVRSPMLASAGSATTTTPDVASELVFLQSRYVSDQVTDRLGFKPDVSADAKTDSRVIEITATAPTAKQAARVADTYASTYVELRSRVDERERRDAASSLQQAIDDVDRALAAPKLSADQRTRLLAQRAAYQTAADSVLVSAQLASHETVSVLSLASTNASKAGPSLGLLAAIGIVGGLILALIVAGIREQLDDRAGDPDDVSAAAGVPVLATLPTARRSIYGHNRPALVSPGSPEADSYALVRTRLQSLPGDKPVAVLQIAPVDRAATADAARVALNLAYSFVRAGQPSVLVCADFRSRAPVAWPVDASTGPGLAGIAAGEAGALEALVPVPGVPRLQVLPAGPAPESAVEALSTPGIEPVLTELGRVADVVIVLSPPVLGPPDASLVAEEVEATVLVVRDGTDRDDLVRAARSLGEVRANPVGAILTSEHPARVPA